MKKIICFLFATLVVIGCKDTSTTDNESIVIPDNIFPMKVGNEWTYYKYKPDNPSIKSSWTLKCLKDTIIRSEKWFVFQSFHNDSIAVGGDWGKDLIKGGLNNNLYLANRSDGVYIAIIRTDSIKFSNLFPKNGQKTHLDEDYGDDDQVSIFFKAKVFVQTSNKKYEAYQFRYEFDKKTDPLSDANSFYLVPDIGIVFFESNEKDYLRGVYDLKDYIVK